MKAKLLVYIMLVFNEKLFYYLENTNERNAITNKAYNYGKINHTWSKRIDDLIYDIGHIL